LAHQVSSKSVAMRHFSPGLIWFMPVIFLAVPCHLNFLLINKYYFLDVLNFNQHNFVKIVQTGQFVLDFPKRVFFYLRFIVTVLVSVMVPGLRHRGLIQQYFGQAMTMVASLLKKKEQEEEKKSN
jgi:hypothetical protein